MVISVATELLTQYPIYGKSQSLVSNEIDFLTEPEFTRYPSNFFLRV